MAHFYIQTSPPPSLVTGAQSYWALECAHALEQGSVLPPLLDSWSACSLIERMEIVRQILSLTGVQSLSWKMSWRTGIPPSALGDTASSIPNEAENTVQEASEESRRRRLWACCDALLSDVLVAYPADPSLREVCAGFSEHAALEATRNAPMPPQSSLSLAALLSLWEEASGAKEAQEEVGVAQTQTVQAKKDKKEKGGRRDQECDPEPRPQPRHLTHDAILAIDPSVWLDDSSEYCAFWLVDRGWSLAHWAEQTFRHPSRRPGPDLPADFVLPRSSVFSCWHSPRFASPRKSPPPEAQRPALFDVLWDRETPQTMLAHAQTFGWKAFWSLFERHIPSVSQPLEEQQKQLARVSRWIERCADSPVFSEGLKTSSFNAWWLMGPALSSLIGNPQLDEGLAKDVVGIGHRLLQLGFFPLDPTEHARLRQAVEHQAVEHWEVLRSWSSEGLRNPVISGALKGEFTAWSQWMSMLYSSVGPHLFEMRTHEGESLLGLLNAQARQSPTSSPQQELWIRKMQWCLERGAWLESIARKVELASQVVEGRLQDLVMAQGQQRDLSWDSLDDAERREALAWVREQRRLAHAANHEGKATAGSASMPSATSAANEASAINEINETSAINETSETTSPSALTPGGWVKMGPPGKPVRRL